jgi:hypothetical protein
VLALAIAFVVGALMFGGIAGLTGFAVGHAVGSHRGDDRGHSRDWQNPPYAPRKAPPAPGRPGSPGKPVPAPSPSTTQ